MKVTVSIIKADVGSVGGHTRPSERMLGRSRDRLREAIGNTLLLDGMVTHTGDDIALIMSHACGVGAADVMDTLKALEREFVSRPEPR